MYSLRGCRLAKMPSGGFKTVFQKPLGEVTMVTSIIHTVYACNISGRQQYIRAVWPLPVAVVTVSDWFVSRLSLVKSSPAESFTEPHTCRSNTTRGKGW